MQQMGMSRKKHRGHLEAIEIDQRYQAKESSKNPQWLSVYNSFSVIKEDTLGPLNSASTSVNISNISALEPNGSLHFFWLTKMESSHRAHLHIPEDFDSFIVNIGDAASDSDSDVEDSD